MQGKEAPPERLRDSFEKTGWKEDVHYGADGMDGTSFGMEKGKILCIVFGEWEGGDDSDPKNKRGDWYKVTIGCSPVQ